MILLLLQKTLQRRYLRIETSQLSLGKIMQRMECLRWWIVFPPPRPLGRGMAYTYLTGVGFLIVASLLIRQCEGLNPGMQ